MDRSRQVRGEVFIDPCREKVTKCAFRRVPPLTHSLSMKRRQRRPFEALGQLAVDETQMALDDDRFDPAKCHHHQESESGSFVTRKFVEARLGFYEQRRE